MDQQAVPLRLTQCERDAFCQAQTEVIATGRETQYAPHGWVWLLDPRARLVCPGSLAPDAW